LIEILGKNEIELRNRKIESEFNIIQNEHYNSILSRNNHLG